jgi:hypothetical protein
MLRKLLLLIALLLLIVIGLVATGILDLNWNGNKAEIRVNPVAVGTESRQVETPTIRVINGQQTQPAQTQPAPAPAPQPQGNAQ